MIDNKTFERMENSSVRLTVTVSADGAKKAYDNRLGKYGSQVQISGFRKGKIPKSVLIRKFGEGIKQEAAADIIDSAMKQALEGVEANPISQPLLEDPPEFRPDNPYEFTVTYDVFPEIVLGEYRGVRIDQPQVNILKKHENEELEAIRERNAVVVDKKEGRVAENAVVTMDYVELGDDDAPVEKTRRKGFVFTVGKNDHPYAVEKEIEGMKAGDEAVIETCYPKDANPKVAGRTVRLKLTIAGVKERHLPDLDDELAQDVSDDLESLDDLLKKVKSDLQERADAKIRTRTINAITDKLVEEASIDVPESMIRSDLEHTWQDYVRQSGASEELLIETLEDNGRSKASILEEWRKDATKSIKTRLIYGKIVENEKIEAEDDEVSAELDKRAEEFNMPAEELEKKFGGGQFRDYLKNELAQKKLFDFLIEAASIGKGEIIDYTDLMNS